LITGAQRAISPAIRARKASGGDPTGPSTGRPAFLANPAQALRQRIENKSAETAYCGSRYIETTELRPICYRLALSAAILYCDDNLTRV
jgi:hypothetical protein